MVIKPDYKHGVPMVTWKMFEEDYRDRHLVHEVLEKWAKEKSNEIALISANTDLKYTWAECNKAATAIAYKLLAMGIKKGDFVATSLPFFPEHVFLMYACSKIGAIIAPLDLRLKPTEVIRCLNLINAKIYAHLGETEVADFKALATIVRDNTDFIEYFIQFSRPDQCMEEKGSAKVIPAWQFAQEAQLLAEQVEGGKNPEIEKNYADARAGVQETDGALVIYTTGSTGYPKPALLSHQGITVQNLCLGWGFKMQDEKDVMLVNLPPSHVGGVTEQFMTPWYFGAKIVLLDIFKPDLTLEAVQKHRVTLFGQIPALFSLEWRLPNYATYDLSSLKFALYGGQAVTRPFLDKLARMARRFGTGLGLTELSGFCTYTPLDGTVDDILAGVGFAMPISPLSIREAMRKDGTAGAEKKAGEVGEICFSGPQVFLGYVNDKENTKKTISKDGWCYSGDLGSYDEAGLHLTGRSKFIIKPKGYQVFPGEVEDFITEKLKDQVETVGVVGMPHEVFSEAIIAFVEVKKGKNLTAEEVHEVCKELAAYKRPLHVIIMDYTEMPLNRVEKQDYQALKNIAKVEVDKLRAAGKWDKE